MLLLLFESADTAFKFSPLHLKLLSGSDKASDSQALSTFAHSYMQFIYEFIWVKLRLNGQTQAKNHNFVLSPYSQ